jgi:hypothetical protein
VNRQITRTKAYKIGTERGSRILGWRIDVEGDDGPHTVRVEIAEAVATSPRLSPPSQEAKKSAGRTAVRPYLSDDQLPTLVVIEESRISPFYDE